MTRKPLTQAQIHRRARRSRLTGRAAELGAGYPPAKPQRPAQRAVSWRDPAVPTAAARAESLAGIRAAGLAPIASDPTRPHGPENHNPRSSEHPDTRRAWAGLEPGA